MVEDGLGLAGGDQLLSGLPCKSGQGLMAKPYHGPTQITVEQVCRFRQDTQHLTKASLYFRRTRERARVLRRTPDQLSDPHGRVLGMRPVVRVRSPALS